MPMPSSVLAFAAGAPITLKPRQHSVRALRLAPPRCHTASPRKVKLFTNGQRLTVQKVPSPPSNVPRYIVCPGCGAAYVANAVNSRLRVSCPSCSAVFFVAPNDLYVALSEAEIAAEEASRARQKNPNAVSCSHMKTCSGCTVRGDATAPPVLSAALAYLNRYLPRNAPPPTVEMGPPHAWRTHAKLAVRRSPRDGRPVLGLFRAGTHNILPIPQCAVHAPEITRAARLVEEVLRFGNVTAYEETTGRGDVRYVLFTVERSTRRVQLTLVWNAQSWKDGAPLVIEVGRELWRRAGHDLLHSIWFNWNTTSTNAIVNPERERYYLAEGEEALTESVCGVELTFPPYVFRQANLDAFEQLLLPRLLTYVPKGSAVVELCAGVGVIGLAALKQRGLRVLQASEIHSGAEKEFWRAARKLVKAGVEAEIDFEVGSDIETIDMIRTDTDVVIVDPPRGGLTAEVVEQLAHPDEELSKLSRIIYISCGFSAFKRDSRVLCTGNNWKLEAAHTYILFPGSDQVETLAIFDRVRYKPQSYKTMLDGQRDKPQRDNVHGITTEKNQRKHIRPKDTHDRKKR